MEKDLNKIEIIAKEKEDENWIFRSFLKFYDEEIDSIVHEMYHVVSSKVDCTNCGNCCKKIQPILDTDDITKLSKPLNINIVDFTDSFLKEDEDGNNVFKKQPCPFLENNKCTHYDSRPNACVSYPHLHKKGFVSRLFGVIDNYSICPIVFNVYELLKKELRDEFEEFEDEMEEYNY
jgi:uncharacterized protein